MTEKEKQIDQFLEQLSTYEDFVKRGKDELKELYAEDDVTLFYTQGVIDAVSVIWEMIFECGLVYTEDSNETN